jgi:hypothetical protein
VAVVAAVGIGGEGGRGRWGRRCQPTDRRGDQTTGVERAQIAVVAAANGQDLLLNDVWGFSQFQQHMAAQTQAGLEFGMDNFSGPQLIELFDVFLVGSSHHHIQLRRQLQSSF